jgi:hypothetical protein
MIQSTLARWFREALAGGKLDRFLGKRSSMRCDWAVPLEIRVENTILSAEGKDFSPKGIGFACERSFEQGEILDLRRNGEQDWIKIRVKHSSECNSEFLIGAEFVQPPFPHDDESHKSPKCAFASTAQSSKQIRREKRLRSTANPPAD